MISSTGEVQPFGSWAKTGCLYVCLSFSCLEYTVFTVVHYIQVYQILENLTKLKDVPQFLSSFKILLKTGCHRVHCQLYEYLETAALTWMEEALAGHSELKGMRAEQDSVERNEFKGYECKIKFRVHRFLFTLHCSSAFIVF